MGGTGERALARLYTAMEALRLYALHRDSLVDKELAAYGAGFALIEETIEEIRAQAFVQTATGSGLECHEKLVGLPCRTTLDTETRRELVLRRMNEAPLNCTLDGVRNSIRAAGMDVEIIENIPGERIVVRYLEALDRSMDVERLKTGVTAVLPAHLEYALEIGELTWSGLEAADANWDSFEDKNFTWVQFDRDGHNLFK